MEIEEPVTQGMLLLPPQGVLGQLKKTWHKRYCQLFKASKYGIERLEIWDSKEDFLSQQSSPKIITLENCVKIGPSNQRRVIAVVTRTLTHHFGCLTESEIREWTSFLRQVAFPDLPSETIEEDNDLYCTSGEGIFSVKLVETEASKYCRLEEKNYTLLIADTELQLLEGDLVLFTWPYRYIRKYGYGEGKFTFEAGRKCSSGEGSFRLEHANQQEIFRCISSKMKSMKKLLRGEMTQGVELNDAQYHAALSMEAGSRSPLPPTPTQTSVNLIDFDHQNSQNSQSSSQSSQRPLFSTSSTSSDSLPFRSPPPPMIPKPTKPPRKFFLPGLRENQKPPELADLGCGRYRKLTSYTSPESGRKYSTTSGITQDDEKHPYDFVEVRNNAWRTHGIDNVVHTERKDKKKTERRSPRCPNEGDSDGEKEEWVEVSVDGPGDRLDDEDSDCQYETMISSSTGLSTPETVTASPIIHNNVPKSDSTANYDTLQHFGSLHRLNSPGYKAPNLSLSLPMRNASSQCNSPATEEGNPSWNDYDVVEDVGAIRLADDSSRGYGVIRKKTNAATNVTVPQHRIFNNSEYAIVSKPKRV